MTWKDKMRDKLCCRPVKTLGQRNFDKSQGRNSFSLEKIKRCGRDTSSATPEFWRDTERANYSLSPGMRVFEKICITVSLRLKDFSISSCGRALRSYQRCIVTCGMTFQK